MNDIRIAEEYFTGWDWARIVAILEEYDDGTAMVVRISPKYLSKPYKVRMYQLTIRAVIHARRTRRRSLCVP